MITDYERDLIKTALKALIASDKKTISEETRTTSVAVMKMKTYVKRIELTEKLLERL